MLVAYAFARRYPAQCARIDLYRAFDKDAEDNRAALQKDGRLKMPVLGMDGTSSFYVGVAKERCLMKWPRTYRWFPYRNVVTESRKSSLKFFSQRF